MQLTAIQRARTYSPRQHAENDRLILESTCRALRRLGCSIRLITEEEIGRTRIDTEVVFSMCQGAAANERLQTDEARGRLIINSPAAVRACHRQNLYGAAGARSPLLPPTVLVDTGSPLDLRARVTCPVWIKRGDVHSTQDGDVVRVSSTEACGRVLDGFRRRGIRTAAIQEHVDGQVIKFYGVVGSSFFRYYAEQDQKLCPVAFGRARPAIEALVRAVGLEVYGGDAVLRPDGAITVIDVNDWPSYAYYRSEAAEAISGHIFGRAVERLAGAGARAGHGQRERVLARRYFDKP